MGSINTWEGLLSRVDILSQEIPGAVRSSRLMPVYQQEDGATGEHFWIMTTEDGAGP
jgi:hypothetical protein